MTKTQKFGVHIPINASAFVVVEAESEQEAIKSALSVASLDSVWAWDIAPFMLSGETFNSMEPKQIRVSTGTLLEIDILDASNG